MENSVTDYTDDKIYNVSITQTELEMLVAISFGMGRNHHKILGDNEIDKYKKSATKQFILGLDTLRINKVIDEKHSKLTTDYK